MLWRRAEPILFGRPNQRDRAAVMQLNDINSPTILLAIELIASTWLVAARAPRSDIRSRICIGLTVATRLPSKPVLLPGTARQLTSSAGRDVKNRTLPPDAPERGKGISRAFRPTHLHEIPTRLFLQDIRD
jgi:hypothetical protein